MLQHMKRCQEKAEERINWLLELENSPFTLNTHYFSDYRAKFLAHYTGARESYRNTDLTQLIKKHTSSSTGYHFPRPAAELTGIAKVLSSLADIGIPGLGAEDLPKLLPPDPMEPALGIMADVRAYFQGWYGVFRILPALLIYFTVSCLQALRGYCPTGY